MLRLVRRRPLWSAGAAAALTGAAVANYTFKRTEHQQRESAALVPTPVPPAVLDAIGRIGAATGSPLEVPKRAERAERKREGGLPASLRVEPVSLTAAVDVLKASTLPLRRSSSANQNDPSVAVLPQGAATGLTGGSAVRPLWVDVPNNTEKNLRPVVLLNMRKLSAVNVILGPDGGQVACLAGTGIRDVAAAASKVGRESHSVLGSFFLNPSVAAGIAFGSGGTQIRKGPVSTLRALWCSVSPDGTVAVHNTLGLAEEPDGPALTDLDQIERAIRSGKIFNARTPVSAAGTCSEHMLVDSTVAATPPASDRGYAARLLVNDSSVSRWNADTSGIDPMRSEGKVLILASVHDTFPQAVATETIWIACDSLELAFRLRNEVLLTELADIPASAEYMDRDAFDVIDRAGRILCHMLTFLGVGPRLSQLWNLKKQLAALPLPLVGTAADRILYMMNNLVPSPLPAAVLALGREKDHHVVVTFGEYCEGSIERSRNKLEQFLRAAPPGSVKIHVCKSNREVAAVGNFRFAAAPAFQTWCIGRNLLPLSVDYALPKNHRQLPDLTKGGVAKPACRMRYSHFGCNVVHEDIAFEPATDAEDQKKRIKAVVEREGGKLPAEHGHGTEYEAPPETKARWQAIDPTNTMNPGVGGLSAEPFYGNKNDKERTQK